MVWFEKFLTDEAVTWENVNPNFHYDKFCCIEGLQKVYLNLTALDFQWLLLNLRQKNLFI